VGGKGNRKELLDGGKGITSEGKMVGLLREGTIKPNPKKKKRKGPVISIIGVARR